MIFIRYRRDVCVCVCCANLFDLSGTRVMSNRHPFAEHSTEIALQIEMAILSLQVGTSFWMLDFRMRILWSEQFNSQLGPSSEWIVRVRQSHGPNVRNKINKTLRPIRFAQIQFQLTLLFFRQIRTLIELIYGKLIKLPELYVLCGTILYVCVGMCVYGCVCMCAGVGQWFDDCSLKSTTFINILAHLPMSTSLLSMPKIETKSS